MTPTEILELFARHFVVKAFRSRFVHEAIKKPSTLHSRICHRIDDVFPSEFRGRTVRFKSADPCLVLGWSSCIQDKTWGEASKEMNIGGGLLIIDCTGLKFHAETEAEPSEVWGGEI